MTSKRLKMCKKALVFFFAFLFSIDSFAAIVSDNDGSAFVTKAEFEALKENFKEQIDNYNTSIDSKIDGAISSYLAGVNLAKKKKIDNYYKSLESKVKWSSAVGWARQANWPIVKQVFNYRHFARTTAWLKKYTASNQNTYMYYGSSDNNGVFTVIDERDMVPTYTLDCDYFFTAYKINSGWTIRDRDPWWDGAFDGKSLNNPNGYYVMGYTPNDMSETSPTSWRGIWTISAYSTSPIYNASNDFVVLPFGTANTYVYDVGSAVSAQSITLQKHTLGYNATGWQTGFQDIRGESAQSVPASSMVWPNTSGGITYPNWNTTKLPWLHTQYKMNELKFNDIIVATGKDLPIKYGVCITNIDSDGTLNTKVKATVNGTAMFHAGTETITWGTPTSKVDGVKYFDCVANIEKEIEFEVEKGDDVWFIYYPSATNVNTKIVFDDLILTEEG